MNLEQLRKQAKELVRAARAGDAGALARLGDLPVRLASAQLVLAREHGHASWSALVHATEASVASFVVAATDGRCERARRLLDARPEIARDPWAALVLGRGVGRATCPRRAVRAAGRRSSTSPTPASHPPSWPASCWPAAPIPTRRSRTSTGRCRRSTARRACVHDPDAHPRAARGRRRPERRRVALPRGRGGGHRVPAPPPRARRRPAGTTALAHAIDDDKLEHVRLCSPPAPTPTRGALLVHAVRRECGAEMLRLLAEPAPSSTAAAASGRPRPRSTARPTRTPCCATATSSSRSLAELGADTRSAPGTSPSRRSRAASARRRRCPPEPEADAQEALILAALRGRLDLVVDALGPGFFGHVGGGPPGTLLHHASWVGDREVVERLLERGADPVARSGAEFDTPIAWAALGSQYHACPGGTTSASWSGCWPRARSSSPASTTSRRARSPSGWRTRRRAEHRSLATLPRIRGQSRQHLVDAQRSDALQLASYPLSSRRARPHRRPLRPPPADRGGQARPRRRGALHEQEGARDHARLPLRRPRQRRRASTASATSPPPAPHHRRPSGRAA